MYGSTMLLTVGHALSRAKDEGSVVRLYVGGDWITGQVMNSDGHGVAVLETNGDLCVVRQDSVTCVRMPQPASEAPSEPDIPHQHSGGVDQPLELELY